MTLERYLIVTNKLRDDCDTLIIRTWKPYKKARDTISRWLWSFLGRRGIGKEYEPHNIHHA